MELTSMYLKHQNKRLATKWNAMAKRSGNSTLNFDDILMEALERQVEIHMPSNTTSPITVSIGGRPIGQIQSLTVDQPNRNHNVYPREVLERAMMDMNVVRLQATPEMVEDLSRSLNNPRSYSVSMDHAVINQDAIRALMGLGDE
jgi:hypothetical protein